MTAAGMSLKPPKICQIYGYENMKGVQNLPVLKLGREYPFIFFIFHIFIYYNVIPMACGRTAIHRRGISNIPRQRRPAHGLPVVMWAIDRRIIPLNLR